MEKEVAAYPSFYPGINELVYAPRWYYPIYVKRDEYSYNIFFRSKKSDYSSYFWPYIKEIINSLKEKAVLDGVDLITIIPASEKGVFSPTMEGIAKKTSEHLSVPFKKIISRVKSGKRSETKGKSAEQRFLLTKGSMEVSAKSGKIRKLLLMDDTKTTGMTILETKKILAEAGINDTITICLGINSNYERGV